MAAYKNIIIILILSILMSLNCILTNKTWPYKLIKDDGIFVEVYDSTNIDENRYTADNIIYSEGRTIEFEYLFIDKQSDTLFFKRTTEESIPRHKRWKFVNKDSIDDETITGYSLTVENGTGGMFGVDSDYDQTVIEYKFIYNFEKTKRSRENTGLLELHNLIPGHLFKSHIR